MASGKEEIEPLIFLDPGRYQKIDTELLAQLCEFCSINGAIFC